MADDPALSGSGGSGAGAGGGTSGAPASDGGNGGDTGTGGGSDAGVGGGTSADHSQGDGGGSGGKGGSGDGDGSGGKDGKDGSGDGDGSEDSGHPGIGTSEDAIIKANEQLDVGDSIESGDYKLTRDDNGYVLTKGEKGQELWGYAGSNDPLTLGFEYKLGRDGSLKAFDDSGNVLETVVPSGLKPHFELILLYHPKAQSVGLKFLIDQAQECMQTGIDLMGSGHAEEAPDLSKWLHNKGLIDNVNSSEMVENYGRKVNDIKSIKGDLKGLDEKINAAAYDTKMASSAVMDDIRTKRDELNDQLIAADEHTERAEIEASPQVKAHIPQDDRYYDRIDPGFQASIEKNLLSTTHDIENLIQQTADANDGRGRDIGDSAPKQPGSSGEGSGAGAGAAPGPGGGQANPPPPAGGGDDGSGLDASGGDVDYSGYFDDLFGGEGSEQDSDATETGADDGTDGGAADLGLGGGLDIGGLDDSAGGTGSTNISSLLDSLRNSLTSNAGGGSGGNSGNGTSAVPAGNNGGGGAGFDPSSMMLPLLMSGMNGGGAESDSRERDLREREQELKKREKELARRAGVEVQGPNGAAANASATGQLPDPAAAVPTLDAGAAPGSAPVPTTLPDNSVQNLPPDVAQAVQKEMSNPNGADARAAYAGTSGDPSSGQWTEVSSNEVKTGDVVQWSERTALVVKGDNGLQFLLNGALVPLDPNNPPDGGNGSYGTYQGLFHPSGLDAASAGNANAAPALVDPAAPALTTAQPPAPAPPPAVAPSATV